jgi:hypothetical protein
LSSRMMPQAVGLNAKMNATNIIHIADLEESLPQL